MADHYDRELKLLSKVKSSMAYPVILLVVTFSVMLLLFVFSLPNFFTMFDGVADLPAITRGIMAISNFLIERWYVVLLVLAAIVGVFAMSKQVEVIARFYDRLKLQIPVFGKLNKRVYMSRFASSMETLYSSGVSIVDAIETSVIKMCIRDRPRGSSWTWPPTPPPCNASGCSSSWCRASCTSTSS